MYIGHVRLCVYPSPLVMDQCRYLKSVLVFRYFLKVCSIFGSGISKYGDIGIGIWYFSTFALF